MLVAACLCLAALLLFILAWRWPVDVHTQAGTSPARTSLLVASDLGVLEPITLRDSEHRLIGKPDAIQRDPHTGQLYPLELKPRRRSKTLYDSDRMQLATYLVLMRATYADRAASWGIVRYQTRHFVVTLTEELTQRVLDTADRVRHARNARQVRRSHGQVGRCRTCPYRTKCTESLAAVC